MTLVKNLNGALPLSKAKVRTVAAVGPHCNATLALQSNYHGTAPYLVSPAAGLAKYASVATELGCAIGQCKGCHPKHSAPEADQADATDAPPSIPRAAALAASADATVLLVGLDGTVEGEGHDRFGIDLPGNQSQLVLEVSKASKGPVVVVFIGGGCVDMAAIKASPHVDAILVAGYPSQEGGNAIAQTIFGDNNPAGRLTQTWYASDFIERCSMFDMNMRPNQTTGCPGRTHRFFSGTPVFAFGEGMGYSRMEYSAVTARVVGSESDGLPRLGVAALDADVELHQHRPHLAPAVLHLQVDITNVGPLDGDEVVLVMVRPPPGHHAAGAPAQSLRNYERVSLPAGGTATVSFGLTAHDLTFARQGGAISAAAGDWRVQVGDAEPVAVRVEE